MLLELRYNLAHALRWCYNHDMNTNDMANPRRLPPASLDEISPYGYCPTCGLPGEHRERRMNGNDRCSGGHTYATSVARRAPIAKAKPGR